MEAKTSKSKIGNRAMHKDQHVMGIPVCLKDHVFSYQKDSTKPLLPDPSSQCQILPSPADHYYKIRTNRVHAVIAKINKFGQNVDILAQGIREHVRLGAKLSETVKGKLSLGTRILQLGGVEKVFRQNFSIKEGEKLLKACQCYLSTTSGPIAGLLFVSNQRVAFSSERLIKLSSANGKLVKIHYKVMIPLRKIKRVQESENVMKPSQKYVQILTEDNFDFWFMGFLNHQRTYRCLQQAIHHAR